MLSKRGEFDKKLAAYLADRKNGKHWLSAIAGTCWSVRHNGFCNWEEAAEFDKILAKNGLRYDDCEIMIFEET